MKFNKGFTLIELLVVIAIIGILSSVVLASLTTARTKGKDAAVQSQMSSMRAQAELFYSTTGANTYGSGATATTSAGTTQLFDGAAGNSLFNLIQSTAAQSVPVYMKSTATAWVVIAQLPSNPSVNPYFCVDNNGNAIATSTATVTAVTCKP